MRSTKWKAAPIGLPAARALERCADRMLGYGLALEAGRYGTAAQELAETWLLAARTAATSRTHAAVWTYAVRVLDGRIAVAELHDLPAPLAETQAQSARHREEEFLLDAAWAGATEAQLAAAQLLLDGRMSGFALRMGYGAAGEAHALLKLAEAGGADVGPALEAARARLSPEALEALDAELRAVRQGRPAVAPLRR